MTANVTEGEIEFDVPDAGKPCKTWYRLVGDLSSGKRPLVTLHGGPGMACEYLFPMADLYHQYQIPIILYDQIGCGRSTHLPEKKGDSKFWTPELFMHELDNLLEKLGVNSSYDLYGQSWGGMLGSLFASRQPRGLGRLILSNSPASMSLWIASCDGLREQLPKDVQAALVKHEKDGTYDDQEYKDAVTVWNEKHLCRVLPWPKEVTRTFEMLDEDPTVYHTMNGPSEFTVVGSLKTYSTVEVSHQINVPTLLINGRFDEGQNSCVYPFFREIPRVRWVTMDQSSHLPMYDERERYMEIIGEFLAE